MILKINNTHSILLLTLQIMNALLKKGFIVFCLIHPIITIICLNAILNSSLHEAFHIGFSRKLYATQHCVLQSDGLSLQVSVYLGENPLKNIIICLSPIVLGIFGLILLKCTSMSPFITIPWLQHWLILWPFSKDMKALSSRG